MVIPEKNQQNFPRLLVILVVLVMVTALLVTAGCLFPASENSTTVPSTCSDAAGVCTLAITRSVRIEAAPQMYTPLMSSTPGMGLTPNVSGFSPVDAEFTWNASSGSF